MKRVLTFLVLITELFSAQNHYQAVWTGSPYQAMNIYLEGAKLGEDELSSGDEIGIFDGSNCVGAVKLSGAVSPYVEIKVSKDNPQTGEIDGFSDGNEIIYKLWKSSESEEITEVTATYDPQSPTTVFTSLGTAFVNISFNVAIVQYTVTTTSNPSEGGATSGGGTYEDGTSVTVIATANAGWDFINWTENGNIASTNTNYTFSVNSNRNLSANFEENDPDPTTHYQAVWTGSPYQAMNIYLEGAKLGEDELSSGDEIGVFDGSNCVGAVKLSGAVSPYVEIKVSKDNPQTGEIDGFSDGNEIIYKLWKSSESEEITEVTATYDPQSPTTVFTSLGTAFVNISFNVAIVQYTVTTTSNPSEGGATSGGGTYEDGTSVTVTATANAGWSFVNWTENGSEVSTNTSYAFTISSNRTFIANFNKDVINHTVTTTSNPSEGGTASGGGTYEDGTSVTVTATANTGWSFVNWTENGGEVSTSTSYTFTVNSDRNLSANFEENEPDPTTHYQPVWTGSPYQAMNIYLEGATLNGNELSSGDEIGIFDGSNCVGAVKLSGAVSPFMEIKVSKDNPQTGKIDGFSEGNEIIYKLWKSSESEEITEVVTTYDPQSPTTVFTSLGTAFVNLSFTRTQVQYTVTTSSNPINGGTTSGGGSYEEGTSITVIATANVGWDFVNWTENGSEVSTNTSYTFTIISNRTIVANFNQDVINYTVTTTSNPSEGGATSGGGTYEDGTSVTVIATANAGWDFVNWMENGSQVSSNTSYTFTVNSNRNLSANFEENEPDPTTHYQPVWTGSPYQAMNIYLEGATLNGNELSSGDEIGIFDGSNCVGAVKLSGAVSPFMEIKVSKDNPQTGKIDGFSEGNEIIYKLWKSSESEEITEVVTTYNPQSPTTVFTSLGTAIVRLIYTETSNNYSVTTSSNPVNGGTTSGGGIYKEGSEVTIQATANEGWNFKNWLENGNTISSDTNYTFTINSDRIFSANFVLRLNKPLCLFPQHGLDNIPTDSSFQWSNVQNAMMYTIQLSTDMNFSDDQTKQIDSIFNNTIEMINLSLEYSTSYWWRVKALAHIYESDWSDIAAFQTKIDVAVRYDEYISKFVVKQNYPNPFNPETTIGYGLPKTSNVKLMIFDILGRPVKSLVNSVQHAGWHETVWDGTNESNELVGSGIYFFRINAGTFIETGKMTFMK